MTQLTINLPEKKYQELQAEANRQGETVDKLIAKCLSLAEINHDLSVQADWPSGFFEQTAGCLRDTPMQRAPQGEYEQRRELP